MVIHALYICEAVSLGDNGGVSSNWEEGDYHVFMGDIAHSAPVVSLWYSKISFSNPVEVLEWWGWPENRLPEDISGDGTVWKFEPSADWWGCNDNIDYRQRHVIISRQL